MGLQRVACSGERGARFSTSSPYELCESGRAAAGPEPHGMRLGPECAGRLAHGQRWLLIFFASSDFGRFV